MKTQILMLLFVTVTISYSQVGIGTTAPQEQLHVSGTTDATIRIDGLSATNNPLNNNDETNVSVDANGNLILSPIISYAPELIINETDYLPTEQVISFTSSEGFNNTTLHNFNINVTEPGLYYISATLSVVISEASGAQPDDNTMRGVQVRLVNGTTILDRRLITHQNSNSSYAINGAYFPKVSSYVYLNAGNNTFSIVAFSFSDASTQIQYGFFDDTMQVIKF